MRRLLLAVVLLAFVPATAHAALSPMPADVTQGNDPGKGTAVVSYLAPTASTFLGPLVTAVTCTPASGSAFPVGVTTITCSAQVAVMCTAFGVPAPQCTGNGGQVITDTGTSTVTIHDVEGPTLDPVSLFVPTPPGQTAAVAHYILNAADNVGVTATNCT